MASPPAKRQRKILLSSDNEDSLTGGAGTTRPHTRTANKSSKSSAKPKSKTKKPASHSSPASSPSKRKRNSDASKSTKKAESLHSFFQPATEEQRWGNGTVGKEESPEEIEDAIEDDSSDEGSGAKHNVTSRKSLPLDRRKAGVISAKDGLKTSQSRHLPNSSQKFVKSDRDRESPSFSPYAPTSGKSQSDHAPWAERFRPENLEELAVHKKKVSDVHHWLADALDGRIKQKALILKGPAGSGKSTVISLLAKTLHCSITEWKNPGFFEIGTQNTTTAQFDDFLNRRGLFSGLEIGEEQLHESEAPDREHGRRILMIEEFPTALSRSSGVLQGFRTVLMQYLTSTFPANQFGLHGKNVSKVYPPIIIIVSEALLTSSISASDTFTAHKMLGPDILNHPAVATIEFNPVAPSFVTKALELIIKKEARCSKRKRTPGPAVIKKLSELGDVRSAVNSLEFLCVRGDQNSNWSGRVAAKPKKSEKEGTALTDLERQSLGLVIQREATLGMFHAVGKVVYNKRDDPKLSSVSEKTSPAQPPEHLKQHKRLRIPQTSVDELITETGTDIGTFISTLHENYALSCNGPHFIDHFADCADILSASDILASAGKRGAGASSNRHTAGYGYLGNSTVDSLRQAELSFHVAVQGLLFALPSPVNRARSSSARRGDAFKMFYPTSLKIWKLTEEVAGLVARWLAKISATAAPSVEDTILRPNTSSATEDGVASWKSWSRGAFDKPVHEHEDSEEEMSPRISVSRDDLLLERLPYMKLISSKNCGQRERKDLERIVKFTGAGIQQGAGEEEEEEVEEGGSATMGTSSAPANELAVEERSPRKQGRWKDAAVTVPRLEEDKGSHGNDGDGKSSNLGMGKLYLSDDDIED
ncbi:MAG: hypothetical protein Q9227_005397 [Pyrenula ochraceoflavens]